MINEREGILMGKLRGIVDKMSPQRRTEDIKTFQETNCHALRGEFWSTYQRLLHQPARPSLKELEKAGVEMFDFGIESLLIKAMGVVRREEVLRVILERGGSLQSSLGEEDLLEKGEIYLLHIHTNDPDPVIAGIKSIEGLEIQGEPLIENLREQVRRAGIVRIEEDKEGK